MHGADEVAGVAGSNMHLELFSRKGVRSIIIERSDCPFEQQSIIHQLLDADWYSVSCNMSPFPTIHGYGPVLLGVTKALCDFCKDYSLKMFCLTEGEVPSCDIKAFMKKYFEIYAQDEFVSDIEKQYPILGRRLRRVAPVLQPWNKKIRNRIKGFFKKIRMYFKKH